MATAGVSGESSSPLTYNTGGGKILRYDPVTHSTTTVVTGGYLFNPADLLRGRMTVFLILPTEHIRTQSALLRLWIGSMLRVCIKGGLQSR